MVLTSFHQGKKNTCEKEKWVCARSCHAVGYSLVITRGNETKKSLYLGNITNEKEWHLHTSFPKIIIGCDYLANFIPNKAILAFWLRSLKTLEYFINLKYRSSSTSLPLRSPNFFTEWCNHPSWSLRIVCRTNLIPSAQLL